MTLSVLTGNRDSRGCSFGGTITKYTFPSTSLGGLSTNFNVFVPSGASEGKPAPFLLYLSGLTCTEDNATQKAPTLFEAASQEGIAVVLPDTSPRGAGAAGEDDGWDFGTGAGFYLNATKEPFKKNYNMEELITKELPSVLKENKLPLDFERVGLLGHSMGGHGALSTYLRAASGTYKSASAFSPICNPTKCPWGEKAFTGYLNGGIEEGKAYDSTLLLQEALQKGRKVDFLIDYGTGDNFYKSGQLLPEHLAEVAKGTSTITVRGQEGYDHSCTSLFHPAHNEFRLYADTSILIRLLCCHIRGRTRSLACQAPQGMTSPHVGSLAALICVNNARRTEAKADSWYKSS